MPETHVARADRRTSAARLRIGGELRNARLAAGLTLEHVGRAVGVSTSQMSRIERATAPMVGLATLSRCAAVLGLDLTVRTYPGGEPLRDIAHLRLTDAFLSLVGSGLTVRAEVPIGDPRDLRAWDLTLADRDRRRCGVELETGVVDVQDLVRKLARKLADGGVERLLLVIADTRANRAAVRAAGTTLGTMFAIDDDAALESLAASRLPPRDALLFVRVLRKATVAAQRQQTTLPRR